MQMQCWQQHSRVSNNTDATSELRNDWWEVWPDNNVTMDDTKTECGSTTMCEAIWIQKLLVSLFMQRMEATNVYCDNQSCIKLSENPVIHGKSKHIDI